MKKKSPKNKEEISKAKIEYLKNNNLIDSYLGNKGYSIYKSCLDIDIINYIKQELIAKPFTNNPLSESITFPVYMESEKKLYVPRMWGINTFGYPKSIKISHGENINLKFKGKLRKEPVDQEEIINSYLRSIDFEEIENKGNSSALIELLCGGGKTVLALKIIEILKKKTIIFVNKTFLRNQWVERINEFLPEARIGTIQGPIIDIEDKDIVIAMIQSISMKSYPDSMFDSFGLSIYDEVHHMSSEVFSNCLKKCTTLYSLGLSATMNRKDGLTYVFKMFIGDICYKNQEKQTKDDVLVKAIDYFVYDDDEYNMIERDYRENVKYTTMLSKISNYEFRSNFIIDVILNEIKLNNDQQILLLAHQRNLLNFLDKNLKSKGFTNIGYYVGGMKEHDLKISETKQVILATYSMAAEALDIKTLTSLVLATPKSDIIQAVGRILRSKHSNPLIIDIIDQHDPFLNQFNKRKSFYNQKNYKIIRTSNNKYIESICNNNINIWSELINRSRKNKIIENEKKCLL